MIKAESLTRTYGNVVAVDGVSFQIEHGEIVGLLGHNGAGKTTIMKMLTGYLEPTKGAASINGVDVVSDRVKVQASTGYLPENCPVYPDMKVLDYLDYIATLRGVPDAKKNERIVYAIEKTRLRDVALQQVNTLSRGYRQRLGVAQAILNSPQILILDEPTNGLDPSQILEMRSLIRELAEKATVVISTHIMQEVQAVCNRVIIINRGKLALDASMKELRTSDRLVVSVDRDRDAVQKFIGDISGVSIVSSQELGEQKQYTLETKEASATEVAPRIAKALIENGCNLYSLQPQVRDLETIFGEITARGNQSAPATNGSNTEAAPAPSEIAVSEPEASEPEASEPEASQPDASEKEQEGGETNA